MCHVLISIDVVSSILKIGAHEVQEEIIKKVIKYKGGEEYTRQIFDKDGNII